MLNGIGAVVGPPILGYAIFFVGAVAFWNVQFILHAGMIVFVLYRMSVRAAVPVEAQGAFTAVRGTSMANTLLPEAEWEGREESPEETHEETPESAG